MCSSYQDVNALGGLAGLVLPLSKCLVTGIPRLIPCTREKEYPSFTVRACDGLSWDTPAGAQNAQFKEMMLSLSKGQEELKALLLEKK